MITFRPSVRRPLNPRARKMENVVVAVLTDSVGFETEELICRCHSFHDANGTACTLNRCDHQALLKALRIGLRPEE